MHDREEVVYWVYRDGVPIHRTGEKSHAASIQHEYSQGFPTSVLTLSKETRTMQVVSSIQMKKPEKAKEMFDA